MDYSFEEAVQILVDGGCEGIQPIRGCAVYVLKNRVLLCSDGIGMSRDAIDYLGRWQLVNPLPQTEEVEVVIYTTLDKDGNELHDYRNFDTVRECIDNPTMAAVSYCVSKGTYTRHILPKKKRREYVGEAYIELVTLNGIIPPHAKIFAEWEEK